MSTPPRTAAAPPPAPPFRSMGQPWLPHDLTEAELTDIDAPTEVLLRRFPPPPSQDELARRAPAPGDGDEEDLAATNGASDDGLTADARPIVRPGDVIGGRYRIRRPVGSGGVATVHLADELATDRQVVLKVLNDPGNSAHQLAAAEELKHLARASHPNVVTIYSVVEHGPRPDTYLVLEYLDGPSLRQLRDLGPVPAHRALTYVADLLAALTHLHAQGVVHGDIKDGNVVLGRAHLKVIDLGAVSRVGRPMLFRSPGWVAPERADAAWPATPQVDVYGAGLTLLSLLGHQVRTAAQPFRMPPPETVTCLAGHHSLDRLVRTATDPDPERRFRSARAMQAQLLGVRREVAALCLERLQPRPVGDEPPLRPAIGSAGSAYFDLPEQVTDVPSWTDLPTMRMVPGRTADRLNQARRRLERGDLDGARRALDEIAVAGFEQDVIGLPEQDEAASPALHVTWLRALCDFADGRHAGAAARFEEVYAQLCGELGVKLALAYSCERAGWDEAAEHFYRVCARTDVAYLPAAAFGLARLFVARARAAATPGDAAELLVAAEQALDLVPPRTAARGYARARTVRYLIQAGDSAAELERARRIITDESLPAERLPDIEADALLRARLLVGTGRRRDPAVREVAGVLEGVLRALAGNVTDPQRREPLIRMANQVHPPSLV